MVKVLYEKKNIIKTFKIESNKTILDLARIENIPIEGSCDGSMACSTCHVYVEENWFNKIPKAEDAEVDMIDMAYEPKKNSRLSCQIIVTDELNGIEVTTPEKQT